MSLDKLWSLFAKKLAGEASEKEIRELEQLIQANPDWQNAIEQMEQLWHTRPEVNDMEVEDSYLSHLSRMREKKLIPEEGETEIPRRKSYGWYWLAAASVLVILSLVVYTYSVSGNKSLHQPTPALSEVSTKPKSKSKLQLPDGSIVWLNADSKLTYTPDFGQETREVTLTGEAFFDVAKDTEKPFIIHAANIKIKVLGTAFNVKAYKNDGVTETSLVRGKIEVIIANRQEPVILRPREKLIVENLPETPKKQIPVKNNPVYSFARVTPVLSDTSIAEMSWIPDELVFRSERFEDLARMMESRFHTKIEIRDAKLREKKFNGSWTNETIEQALEALKYSVSFEYKITTEGIIIYKP